LAASGIPTVAFEDATSVTAAATHRGPTVSVVWFEVAAAHVLDEDGPGADDLSRVVGA
jgi:hypothetical protein